MKSLILLAAAVTAGTGPRYHFDLAHLYASPGIEQAHRVGLLTEVDGFLKQPASSLDSPGALSHWLASYDSLSRRLNRHDLYVYLRAEEDTKDRQTRRRTKSWRPQ